MRFRNLAVGLCAGLAVLVLAQSGNVAIGVGRGRARGDHDRVAEFQFEVSKRREHDQVLVRGNADFIVGELNSAPNARVRVHMREAAEAEFMEHRVRFAGPGSIRLMRDGHVVERNGRVIVFGMDNRPPGPNGANLPPDRVGVQFNSPAGGPNQPPISFSFEGNVVDGDVRVTLPNAGGTTGGTTGGH